MCDTDIHTYIHQVGVPGALMEGAVARLNKKAKEWEDRYCVLICGQQVECVLDDRMCSHRMCSL